MYKRGSMNDWLDRLREEYKITPIPEISVLSGVEILPLCTIINAGELIPNKKYETDIKKIKKFLSEKYKSDIQLAGEEAGLFLSLMDFIFTESEVPLDDILAKYKPPKAVVSIINKAVAGNMITERKEILQKNMSTRGRPKIKTFYSISCCCPSPGLMVHCRQCSLGRKLISIEGIGEVI